MWTLVITQLSVFTVATGRGVAGLQKLVGNWHGGTITSDWAKAYGSQPLRRRQLCPAKLRRDFQAMINRRGPGQVVSEPLLEHASVLFAWWHWVRDGTWKRSTLQSYVGTLRVSFELELEWDSQNVCPKTATCRELLAREAALWTFVRVAGIEPTNSSAERRLRGAVLWRKVSFGTQSESGSRFVASVLTVLLSFQQQHRNALAYLTACCQAFYANQSIPVLAP